MTTTTAPASVTALPSQRLAGRPIAGLGTLAAWLHLMLLLPVLAVSAVLLRRRPDADDHAWAESSRLWAPADGTIELSVVVPFYNPGDSMRPTVERLVGLAAEEGVQLEVIAVSDGSTDGSERSLDGLGEQVRVIACEQNRGKGAALHTGFAHARGSYVGFVDADGDIDPEHLLSYLRVARAGDHHVVYASKRHEAARSESSALRKVISRGFSGLVTALFALGVSDTQTGAKVFRRDVLADVLPRLRERRFAFDLEFFVAAKAAGYRDLVAAPVHLGERLAGSTVTSTTVLRTLGDALAVLGRLHLRRTYRPAARPVAVLPAPRPAADALLPSADALRSAYAEAA